MASGIAGLTSGLHLAVRVIVEDALSRGVDSSMPTNVAFQERYGISAGTMQRALALLADRGALEVVSRGHLGRVIRSLDLAQCWQAAGLDPVRLALPPSGPPEADVLADQLAEGLTASGIPHTVRHLPGGTARLAAVRAGAHDLTVVSAGSWADSGHNWPTDDANALLRELPAGTYYAPGRLVVVRLADDTRAGPVRVAIDENSPDHASLTMVAFPPSAGHEYLPTTFPGVPRAVLSGEADAGVWHIARSVVPLRLTGLRLDPFSDPAAVELARVLSPAVLVGTPDRPELRPVIAGLDLGGLVEAQRRALADAED